MIRVLGHDGPGTVRTLDVPHALALPASAASHALHALYLAAQALARTPEARATVRRAWSDACGAIETMVTSVVL